MGTVTEQCRVIARQLHNAMRFNDVELIAEALAAIHERAVACAVVRVERELSKRETATELISRGIAQAEREVKKKRAVKRKKG